jgi:hypothetical protein
MEHDPATLITLILGAAALSVGLVLARRVRRRSDNQVQEMQERGQKSQELLQALLDAQQKTNLLLKELLETKK